MSVFSSKSGGGRSTGAVCSSCYEPKLRSNERHDSCFDCLSDGPRVHFEQRCDICRGWAPRHFIEATKFYESDSPARLQALAYMSNARLGVSSSASEPPPVIVHEVGTHKIPSADVTVEAPPHVESDAPPLSASPQQISREDLSLMASFVSLLKGPQLPGLSALLQKGVPAGTLLSYPGLTAHISPQTAAGITGIADPRAPCSSQTKRALESVSDAPALSSDVKKMKPAVVGQPAESTLLQDKVDTVPVEQDSEVLIVRDAGQSVSSGSGPSGQVGGSHPSDGGLLHVPLSVVPVSQHGSLGRLPREGVGLGGHQAGAGDLLVRVVDSSGRGVDSGDGHLGFGTGQTRPNVSGSKTLPLPSLARGGRAALVKADLSYSGPTRAEASPADHCDQAGDVEMIPDDRVTEEVSVTDSGAETSVFRWALGSIALRLGEEQPTPSPAVGSGAFQSTPELPFIQLRLPLTSCRRWRRSTEPWPIVSNPARQNAGFLRLPYLQTSRRCTLPGLLERLTLPASHRLKIVFSELYVSRPPECGRLTSRRPGWCSGKALLTICWDNFP